MDVEIGDQLVHVERIGTDGDKEKAKTLFSKYDGKVDAFDVGFLSGQEEALPHALEKAVVAVLCIKPFSQHFINFGVTDLHEFKQLRISHCREDAQRAHVDGLCWRERVDHIDQIAHGQWSSQGNTLDLQVSYAVRNEVLGHFFNAVSQCHNYWVHHSLCNADVFFDSRRKRSNDGSHGAVMLLVVGADTQVAQLQQIVILLVSDWPHAAQSCVSACGQSCQRCGR